MKKTFKYIALVLFAAAFSSCDEEGYEDFTIEKTDVKELSGDWYVQTFVDGDMVIDYTLLTTSNTANDKSALKIFDHEEIWEFNAPIPANIEALTFEGENIDSKVGDYEITVTVTNGKVEKNATFTSDTNLAADFISFDIEFSDDPGTIYHIEGFKRSGFLEDEH